MSDFAIDPQDLKQDEVLTRTADKDFEVIIKVRDDVDDKRLNQIFEHVRGMIRYYRYRKTGKG